MVVYLQWVRRFRTYCDKRKLPETEHLTAVGVQRFTRGYVGPRLKGDQAPGIAAISQTMRFTHGLARWLRWEQRCRPGATAVRRCCRHCSESIAITGVFTMESRRERWFAMLRPRVASSAS